MIRDRKEGGVILPTRLCEALRGYYEGLYGLYSLYGPHLLFDCIGFTCLHAHVLQLPLHLHSPTPVSDMSNGALV
jgi:hypothetical protein